MILGGTWQNSGSNRSEDLFFFFQRSQRFWEEHSKIWDKIEVKTFLLEIVAGPQSPSHYQTGPPGKKFGHPCDRRKKISGDKNKGPCQNVIENDVV